MRKTKLELDIEASIRLLRFLTKGEGYSAISVFDAGAGGGFMDGHVQVNLERSGLILNKTLSTTEEMKSLLLDASRFLDETSEECAERYKKPSNAWDE